MSRISFQTFARTFVGVAGHLAVGLGAALLVVAAVGSAAAAPKASGANAMQPPPGAEPAQARARLSSAQRRTVYQSIVNEAGQALPPKTKASVGTELPPEVSLSELPSVAAEQIPAVRNLQYAKLQDGKVLLVDPATRRVAFSITKKEGSLSRATAKPAPRAPKGATGNVPAAGTAPPAGAAR